MDSHFASSSVLWGAVVVANQFYCRGLERLWLVRPDVDVKFCGADIAGSSVSGKKIYNVSDQVSHGELMASHAVVGCKLHCNFDIVVLQFLNK